MSFDEQPDDPHGECRHEIKRLQARLAEVEAERDQQLEMSEQLARERVAEAAHRKRAEARAEQAERERDEARALVDTLRDQRARLLLAAAGPDPLPEGARWDGDALNYGKGLTCKACVGWPGEGTWHAYENGGRSVTKDEALATLAVLSRTAPPALPEGARVAIQAAIAYVEGEGPCSFADDIEPYCSDDDCPYCKFARALDGEADRLRAVLSRAKDA